MPIEYSGEDETISAVGLVRPKPGIFVEAIQYLLVVCTTIEVCSHTLQCSRSSRPVEPQGDGHEGCQPGHSSA